MRLLVTRPEPDAERTAQVLRARGHQVLVAPLSRMEPIDADLSGHWTAILMTSANAARVFSSHRQLANLIRAPVFAVGDRSADAAREAGFADVTSAQGALADLVRLVATKFAGNPGTLLYVAGEDRAGDLAGELAAHGIAVRTAVAYRVAALPVLPVDLKHALMAREIDGALHYSARSLAILLKLADGAGALNAVLNLAHYCLSAAVAAPLRDRHAGRISIAPVPEEAALIDLIGSA